MARDRGDSSLLGIASASVPWPCFSCCRDLEGVKTNFLIYHIVPYILCRWVESYIVYPAVIELVFLSTSPILSVPDIIVCPSLFPLPRLHRLQLQRHCYSWSLRVTANIQLQSREEWSGAVVGISAIIVIAVHLQRSRSLHDHLSRLSYSLPGHRERAEGSR
jgi:hypothetical protein